jgi:hypothetical protein
VKNVAYSVPARLIGQRLRARVYEERVELYHRSLKILEVPRSKGGKPVIDFRHVIESLLRKPGAFSRYYYREALFPSLMYRRAFDRLVRDHGQREGELEYLRLLKLTAEIGQSGLEGVLSELIGPEMGRWRVAELRSYLFPREEHSVPSLESSVDLALYDRLLEQEVEVVDVA